MSVVGAAVWLVAGGRVSGGRVGRDGVRARIWCKVSDGKKNGMVIVIRT